jgi:uncharacterized protein YbjT (DUF2867 family)
MNALLAGATGLVGGRCLERLLADSACRQVVVLGRRPLTVTHEKVQAEVVDFARLIERPTMAASVALCALGTTVKQAGSREAFRAVDHDAVAAFARWALHGGCWTFVLVSSVGADRRSRSFYLRVKGEVEETIARIGFRRFVALRPSFLLGARGERRPAEAIVQAVVPALAPVLAGPLRRYRAISADAVAAAMIAAAQGPEPGRFIWEHDRILHAAGQ